MLIQLARDVGNRFNNYEGSIQDTISDLRRHLLN